MNLHTLRGLKAELDRFLSELMQDIPRSDQRRWAQLYVRGLMLDGARKSIEPMAKRLQEIEPQSHDVEQALQQVVNQSPWSVALARDRLQAWAAKRLPPGPESVLIVDDTGFLKQGKHSVGVDRQYTGTAGKVCNCQIGVTLQWVSAKSVLCVDAQLYLPDSWTADNERLHECHVPKDVGFQAKWKIALSMIARAKEHGLNGTVLADAGFGNTTAFRQALDKLGLTYCVGIESTLAVIGADVDLGPVPQWKGQGRKPTRPSAVALKGPPLQCSVKAWAHAHKSEFYSITWREGSKGKLRDRFGAWRVRPAHKLRAGRCPSEACWLLIQWPGKDKDPFRYFLCNMPKNTSLKKLVRTAKSRHWVEQSYEEMKGELGLDHFEGRSWQGWHHHVMLVMMASAFLIHYRQSRKRSQDVSDHSRDCSAVADEAEVVGRSLPHL